jgi:hypothetical protein
MKKLIAVLALGLVAGCGIVERSAAPPRVAGNHTVCWNAHGYPFPQPPAPCPPCWEPEPFAQPLPLGVADPCILRQRAIGDVEG